MDPMHRSVQIASLESFPVRLPRLKQLERSIGCDMHPRLKAAWSIAGLGQYSAKHVTHAPTHPAAYGSHSACAAQMQTLSALASPLQSAMHVPSGRNQDATMTVADALTAAAHRLRMAASSNHTGIQSNGAEVVASPAHVTPIHTKSHNAPRVS